MSRLDAFAQMRANDCDGYRQVVACMFSAASAARKYKGLTETQVVELVLGRNWQGKQ